MNLQYISNENKYILLKQIVEEAINSIGLDRFKQTSMFMSSKLTTKENKMSM